MKKNNLLLKTVHMATTIKTFVILIISINRKETTFIQMFDGDITFGINVPIFIGDVRANIASLEWISEGPGKLQKKYRGRIPGIGSLEMIKKVMEQHGWT